ncbi:MAG: tryptophan synthase subunit alpha [Candidatus Omnitrophica bacterium]|nr:tryptophan synthase subunit alpha [Candidatus Omnitrophota bacterium]
MNRIDETFDKLKKENRKAFIAYVAAGDPSISATSGIVAALESSGADIIELGIPFSDPLADGPTIQKAVERALKAGCTARKVINMVKDIRKKVKVPLVFMTYYNIILHYGIGRFVREASGAGADGVIVPDLPLEEAGELLDEAGKSDFKVILLAAPTTSLSRFRRIASRSGGFIYYVSLTGVTGAREGLPSGIKRQVKALKRITKKPVCVGFGVSTPAQAREVASCADGVIVGSALVRVIEENPKGGKKMLKDLGKLASSLSRAVHGVR